MSYVLSCCSTADMKKSHFVSRDIHYLCFHYYLDDVCYSDDLGESMSFDDFYNAMRNGSDTRTSQPNPGEYRDYFEKFLKQGLDILHITLSSGISGAFNSASVSAAELSEEYPDRKIVVLDSFGASAGYGLLMDKLADLRDNGMEFDDLVAKAKEIRFNVCSWFFTTDLTYLIRGGRVSKTAGFVGQVLNICPLLMIDKEGKLIAKDKIRTKKKVMQAVLSKMEELAEGGLNYEDKCFISMSQCEKDAEEMAKLIEDKFPKLNGYVEINNIGTTIGSHTGPGTIAVFWWGNNN